MREMIETRLKLLRDGTGIGDLKLLNAALRELRYAFKVFAPYRGVRKVSVFGSARTPPDAPAYRTAREFSRQIAARGFMVITGGGHGIMRACQEGAGRERSFGVNIRLPFEQDPNEFIHDDPKLVTFRYFFTRKLMFVKEADAIVLFPGGFGTHDEGYEALTLVQTGKMNPMPDRLPRRARAARTGRPGSRTSRTTCCDRGLISAEDLSLFKVTDDASTRRSTEITGFYRVYHSSRYVGRHLVIRLNRSRRRSARRGHSTREFAPPDRRGRDRRRRHALAEEARTSRSSTTLPRLVFAARRHQLRAPAPAHRPAEPRRLSAWDGCS